MGNRRSSLCIFHPRHVENEKDAYPLFEDTTYDTEDGDGPHVEYSTRSNSFLGLKPNLYRQATLITHEGSNLYKILFHETYGPLFRDFASQHFADEPIHLAEAVMRFRQDSYESNQAACNAIWYQFIAKKAPYQINIRGSLMDELNDAFHDDDFEQCLLLYDRVANESIDDMKNGDILRLFIARHPKVAEYLNT